MSLPDLRVSRDKKGYVTYVVNMVNYTSPGTIESACNAIIFINKGTSITVINGIQIFPSESLAIDGNFGEVDVTNYNLNFVTAAGEYNSLVVVRKVYQ